VAGIEPGGYLFYDSTKPLPASKFRDDIVVLGVPLTAICNREYTDPRQRQLFKNIIISAPCRRSWTSTPPSSRLVPGGSSKARRN